jgi:hypothetical protein
MDAHRRSVYPHWAQMEALRPHEECNRRKMDAHRRLVDPHWAKMESLRPNEDGTRRKMEAHGRLVDPHWAKMEALRPSENGSRQKMVAHRRSTDTHRPLKGPHRRLNDRRWGLKDRRWGLKGRRWRLKGRRWGLKDRRWRSKDRRWRSKDPRRATKHAHGTSTDAPPLASAPFALQRQVLVRSRCLGAASPSVAARSPCFFRPHGTTRGTTRRSARARLHSERWNPRRTVHPIGTAQPQLHGSRTTIPPLCGAEPSTQLRSPHAARAIGRHGIRVLKALQRVRVLPHALAPFQAAP